MRPDPTGQINNFLAVNRNFIIVDLYTFFADGGEVLRYSGYNIPFTVPGSMFDVHSLNTGAQAFVIGPRFGRSKTTTRVGLQVDTLDLAVYAGSNDVIGSLSWQVAARLGVFDLAKFELGRLVCQAGVAGTVGPFVGYVVWFQGLVGDIEIGRTAVTMTVNSSLTLLTAQYPRRLWQHTCSHVFGDAGCQFDRQSMAMTIQAASGSDQSTIFQPTTPSPATLYSQGTCVGMSGQNYNFKRTVAYMNGATVFLSTPFIYPVAVGDYFSLLPGCDHSLNACQNIFNNLQHYGGQPYIPQAEFAV